MSISSLSEAILEVTIQYLGPASKRFLERQTKYHLDGLAFDDIKKEQIPELAKWVEISAKLLVDERKAVELAGKIQKLG